MLHNTCVHICTRTYYNADQSQCFIILNLHINCTVGTLLDVVDTYVVIAEIQTWQKQVVQINLAIYLHIILIFAITRFAC